MGGRRSRTPGAWIALWAIGTALVGGAERPARAEPPAAPGAANDLQEAKAAYLRARRLYNVGMYREAARAFAESYRLCGSAMLLFNVGQAYRLAGDPAAALSAYKAFVREAPEHPQRSFAEAKVDEMRAQMASGQSLQVSQTAGDRVLSQEQGWDAQGPDPAPAARPIPRWAPWAGAGTTLALAVGATLSGLSGNAKYEDLESSCGGTPEGCPQAEIDEVAARARLTNVLWIAAALTGVATGLLVAVDASREGASVQVASRF